MKDALELAEDIIKLCDVPTKDRQAIRDATCRLESLASNPSDFDYWRVFYKALSRIAENIDL